MNHESTTLRVSRVEFRWSDINKKYEMLRWHNRDDGYEFCTVIAFFHHQSEGYDMRTVGRRYEEALREWPDAVQITTRYAFDFLQARFNAEESIKQLQSWM